MRRELIGGLLWAAAAGTFGAAAGGTGGCAGDAPTSRPVTDAERHQDDILAHPDAYGGTGTGNRSIFGTDDRDTLGHDLHSVFFP